MEKIEAEQNKRGASLAKEVLRLARSEILVRLGFLGTALYRLKDTPAHCGGYALDGNLLCYADRHVLLCCREERETVARDILHMLFHCLFLHPYVGGEVDALRYDLACDIAVENVINELGLESLTCKRQNRQDQLLDALEKKTRFLSAEKIYRLLLHTPYTDDELTLMREDFFCDDHTLWYLPETVLAKIEDAALLKGADGIHLRKLRPATAAASAWRETARSISLDMETFSVEWGDRAGSLRRTLGVLLREKYDYRDFLRRFAVSGETLHASVDEFDYIFYTYGLQLYGNMPLVEPLEYREETRIRDFVIAIDTSASVSVKLVQGFLQKTYDILCEENSYFDAVKLHVIQCDAEISEDAVITTKQEFAHYLEHMEIKGFGGTDFRPVFYYVNELVANHHFQQLRGLLYFTDGYGTYPVMRPDYEAAFIFLEGEGDPQAVPAWAMKVILRENEVLLV